MEQKAREVVENLLDTVLSASEQKRLKRFIKRNKDAKQFPDGDKKALWLGMSFYNLLALDTHETLKKLIADHTYKNMVDLEKKKKKTVAVKSVGNLLGVNDLLRLARILNPQSVIKKAYIVLDTKFAKFSNNNQKVSWDYSRVLIQDKAVFSSTRPIRDITSVRLHSITVPYLTSPMKRATIYIEEFQNQAFMNPDGTKFHFVALLNDQEDPILTDDRNSDPILAFQWNILKKDITTQKHELLMGYRFNEGRFHFTYPVTVLNSFTLQIRSPFNLHTLPTPYITDCSFTSINYNRITTQIESPGYRGQFLIELSSDPHLPSQTGPLRISGYTTSDAKTDEDFITFVNGTEFTNWSVSGTTLTIYPRSYQPVGVNQIFKEINITSLPNAPTGVSGMFNVEFLTMRSIITLELKYMSRYND